MFLKQKRDGKIKGCGYADSRKQQAYINKDKASTPTVVTKTLLLICLINAVEGCEVATVNIPGAFMQSDMEGPDNYMKMEGRTVQILSWLDPKLYTKFIKQENGKSFSMSN